MKRKGKGVKADYGSTSFCKFHLSVVGETARIISSLRGAKRRSNPQFSVLLRDDNVTDKDIINFLNEVTAIICTTNQNHLLDYFTIAANYFGCNARAPGFKNSLHLFYLVNEPQEKNNYFFHLHVVYINKVLRAAL